MRKDMGNCQLLIQHGSDLYIKNVLNESSLEMIFAWNKKEIVDLVKKILKIKNPGKMEEFGGKIDKSLQFKF